MLFFLIIGLLLGAILVIFALQNVTLITVTFLFWELQGSLALILILAVIAGMFVSVFVSIPELFAEYRKYKELKRENKRLEDEIESYKKTVAELNVKMANTTSANNSQGIY